MKKTNAPFQYRVGFLGCPSNPDFPWTQENLQKLVDLGFNTIQLNIAWGPRPGDEPLNLEDVVDMDKAGIPPHKAPLQLVSGQEPAQIEKRRKNLRDRIALCKEMGLRSIFHFGAPYNMHAKFGDNPPNCLMNPEVVSFYSRLLEALAEQYPGIDDILIYTYDQDAWLCSEFGQCPTCRGVPLHERVSKFVNLLAETWQRLSPGSRTWWEPWELSAGQVFKTILLLDAGQIGLSLHSNVAEVMAAMPVDRWLEISVRMARSAGLPVIVEHFLAGPTEEVEPFTHLCWPLVLLRSLKKIAAINPDGIKEYYGLVPVPSDVNLRMTGLFLKNPEIGEEESLRELAGIYGECADGMVEFWRKASEAMEVFPWNTSWWIREIGKCDPFHSYSAAFIRGQQAHTPSWESTRRAIFMKTDNVEPDSWMMEDVQLQCELCVEKLLETIAIGESICAKVPEALRPDFEASLREYRQWVRVARSYAYHLRETNLTRILRDSINQGQSLPENVVAELRELLKADMANHGQPEPCLAALGMLDADPAQFVDKYFVPGGPDLYSKGQFSVTSR